MRVRQNGVVRCSAVLVFLLVFSRCWHPKGFMGSFLRSGVSFRFGRTGLGVDFCDGVRLAGVVRLIVSAQFLVYGGVGVSDLHGVSSSEKLGRRRFLLFFGRFAAFSDGWNFLEVCCVFRWGPRGPGGCYLCLNGVRW